MSYARSGARRRVVQALYQWQLTGQEAGGVDTRYLLGAHGGKLDRAYFDTVFHEVLRHLTDIDGALAGVLDRPIQQVDPVERAVLRLGVCELKYHPEIPFRVVINEAVELAKLYGAEQGHRYVNGILDRLAVVLRPAEAARGRKAGPGEGG